VEPFYHGQKSMTRNFMGGTRKSHFLAQVAGYYLNYWH
jgi:hypothetical protein